MAALGRPTIMEVLYVNLFFGQFLICTDILNKSLPIMTFAIAAHFQISFLHTFSKYISFLILFKYE